MPVELFELNELSLERAKAIAPEEFIPAYDLFEKLEGTVGPRPWRDHKPPHIDITLIHQRGIAKPADFPYAISVSSTRRDEYADDCVFEQDDGTWILRYCEHRNISSSKPATNAYNDALRACLRDGLPVGVFIAEKKRGSSYLCKGLAFVESYDAATRTFSLHGPVNSKQPTDYWSIVSHSDMDPETKELLTLLNQADFKEEDERIVQAANRVRRVQQERFRKKLLRAYSGKCAMTGYDVDTALQAAHISAYRGPRSQFTSNGLLLRADIHLLYDAHRISVCPDDLTIRMGSDMLGSRYADLNGVKIALPSERHDRPSENRLATHFAEFRAQHNI